MPFLPSLFKKAIYPLFFILCFFTIVSPVSAQIASGSAQSPINYAPSGYIDPQSPLYSNKMVYNSMHAFACIATGWSFLGPCLEYKLTQDLHGNIRSVPMLSSVDTSGGLLGTTGSILVGMYTNPPINSHDYIASLGQELGISEAHAQVGGSGTTVLSPIFNLWEVSRNIVYLMMIIIFVVIGLMVMFRQKLNPQTVISIQTALPGLVIGLVLITFSYFIASVVTDVAFIGTDLVGYYFDLAGVREPGSPGLTQETSQENVLSIFSPNIGAIGWRDIQLALDQAWNHIVGFSAESTIRVFTGLAAYQFGVTFGPAVSQVIAGSSCAAATAIPGAGIGAIAAFTACAKVGKIFGENAVPAILGTTGFLNPPFVISFPLYFATIFIMLYAMGRLLLRLINCYLSIIFYTITGPFTMMVAALPGRQGLATAWIRNILCNVLAFPAVMAVFYFAAYLIGPDHGSPLSLTGVGNLSAGGNTFPLFGGIDLRFIRILVAFGALVASPSIPDMICKAVGKEGGGLDMLSRTIEGNIRSGQGYSGEYSKSMGQTFSHAGGTMDRLYGKKDRHGGEAGDLEFKAEEGGQFEEPGWMSRRFKGLGAWSRQQRATKMKETRPQYGQSPYHSTDTYH